MSRVTTLTPKQILQQNTDLLGSTETADFIKIAEKLDRVNPEFAKKFRSIDFMELKEYLVKETLKELSLKQDLEFKETFECLDDAWDLIKNKVKVIGSVKRNGYNACFYLDANNNICLYSSGKSNFSSFVKDFESVYRESAMKAALQIIAPSFGVSGNVSVEKHGDVVKLKIG